MTGTHEKHDAFKELIKHLDNQLQYRQQLVNQLEQENTQVLRCLEQIKAKNEELMKVRQLKKDMATNQENIKMNDNEPHGKRLNTRPSNNLLKFLAQKR